MKYFLPFSFAIIVSFFLSGCLTEFRNVKTLQLAQNFRAVAPLNERGNKIGEKGGYALLYYEALIEGRWYRVIRLDDHEYYFGPHTDDPLDWVVPESKYKLTESEAARLKRNQIDDSGGDGGGDSGW